MRNALPPGCLALALILFFAILMPLFLADALLSALGKLGLNPQASLLIGLGIFLGGMINIPVRRMVRERPVEDAPQNLFGMQPRWLQPATQKTVTILAVNLGGCIIPLLLVIYEVTRTVGRQPGLLPALLIAVIINIGVSYKIARPIQGVGIAMSPILPALVPAVSALLLAPEQAPSIAFTAGVLGPLVGADLLHLSDINRISTGLASIGGAGTFDGIVIASIIATLLA